MFSLFRTRLVVKLALLTALAVGLGFALLAAGSARIESNAIEDLHRESARAIATSLAAGVRNSMLTGNGIAVRDLLADAKTGLGTADVHVYAPSGEEVFGVKAPPPAEDKQPAHVHAVLSTHKAAPDAKTSAEATPIDNEKRCRTCHADGDLRGVLTLGTKGARIPIDGSDASLDALAAIARSAFIQIMTAKEQDRLDDFFAELAKASPGIRGIAIYTTVAERKYGEDVGISDEVVLRGTQRVPPFTEAKGDIRYRVIPLPNDKRCQGCHKAKEDMRGAMVVAFEPAKLEGVRTLQATTNTALGHVMLSGLGRMIAAFMDDVAHAGVVTTLTVHDDEGRLYHDAFAAYDPPSAVRTVLDTHDHFESPDLLKPEFLFVEPLKNDVKCQRCHGPDLPLRGAIAIKLDTSKEVAAIQKLRTRSIELGAATVACAIALLWLVLRATVLGPVQKIGRVAERVGAGDFSARLTVPPEGSSDEMGRLAGRINDMIAGLRQKLTLSKFVSEETLRTVESDGSGVIREGIRQRVTMLFSDIRGFTAFSETRSPEEVVAMLNEYLQVQAEVVSKHGGDIDKFVGDELMARFTGDDAELRATRCAVEMIGAVARLESKASHALTVGVGLNAGDVILGSVGARHRLDFTVIGDAVNLAARLCSAAKGNEALATETIRAKVTAGGANVGVTFEALEPIRVKGKAEPIPIYRVTPAA